jgi:hypothetical protein
MKTEVFLERSFLHGKVRQSNQTGFFSVNDLLLYGNKWRITHDLKLFNYSSWYNSSSTKGFLKELTEQYGEIIISKKGKTGERWVHPFIFLDIALAINPALKVEVYRWIYDELIKYRNDSGDSYRKMCGALYLNSKNKSNFFRFITKTAIQIQEECDVKNWQQATEEQLKLRNKIHDNISLLCDVLRNNRQAVRIGIQKALEEFNK